MTAPQIFIVGLDAASWDLLQPWTKSGELPNLAKLIEQGVSGDLQSAIPPLTPPAWTSFMTGVNPGKHGIFHFLETQPDSYDMRYTNAGSRRARTLWSILSDAGLKVGAINIPFTYPPEPLNGFQISGMDTPSEQSAFIHPPELREEIELELGEALRLEVRYLGFMSSDARRDAVLDELRQIDEQWTKIALLLLERHPVDVMMVTFMSIDTVQHYFWHYMDERHFLHDSAGAGKYRHAIKSVYQRLDRALGQFLTRLPAQTTVLVASDHGGGPVSDRVVYLNRYLCQIGLLKYREHSKSMLGKLRQKVVRSVYQAIRSSLTSSQKKWLADLFPALRQKFESAYTSFADIDWSATKAYCSEVLAYPPSICLNIEGERPEGIVNPGEREALMELITKKLTDLRDPRDGSLIISRVFRREELFDGPCANEAPDLVLDWWSGGGFAAEPSFAEDADKPVLKIRERAPMREPEWSGTHRLQGVMILRGKAAKPGVRIEDARLIDIAPTLLYLLRQKIPSGLDGRVLTEALDPAFVATNPLRYDQNSEPFATTSSAAYSIEEAALVEERLKALGYVD